MVFGRSIGRSIRLSILRHCLLWTSIAWTSGSILLYLYARCGGRLEKELQHAHKNTHTRHTAMVGEVRGAQLGKRLPRLGAAWGKQVQIANNNPPASRSPVCLAPPRTSSESGSGSRTKVTL